MPKKPKNPYAVALGKIITPKKIKALRANAKLAHLANSSLAEKIRAKKYADDPEGLAKAEKRLAIQRAYLRRKRKSPTIKQSNA